MFSDLRYRLRALVDRAGLERELDDELRFHLEREVEKHVAAGLPRDEAMRRARLAFGGVERVKEDARDARGISVIDVVRQDLRYAWRGLRNNPGFATAVIVTLGLGMGANAAMFGIVDRLLFRAPSGMVAPERVHRLYVHYLWNGSERLERNFAYRRYEDFTRDTRSFDKLAAFAGRQLAIGIGQDSREMTVGTVSATLFDFYNVRPRLGRFFTTAEDTTPAGALVAVLTYPYWQTRHGGASDVLGKSIHIDSQIYTIIGVAPEGFSVPLDDGAPAVLVPITAYASSRNAGYYRDYGWTWLEILARRKSSVTVEAADADLTAAFAMSWAAEAEGTKWPTAAAAGARGMATPLHLARGPEPSRESKVATWVMGVALIVLLVACANVANLMLVRAVSRRREIALRLALGVTRTRLVAQLVTESLLVALLGGVAGVVLARWGGQALRAMFLADDASATVTDARTVLFIALLTAVVALVTGLAPISYAMRETMAESLKSGAREGTYRRSRLRTGLLVLQGTLSVVLLVGAGLFVRSLINVRSMRLGYDVDPIVYLEANARGVKLTDAEVNALADRLLAAARTVPGVQDATLTISVPFWSSEGRGAPHVPGLDSVARLGRFALQAGSPSYFRTFGTRIVRGRGITDEDRAGAPPVAIVNEAMAKALWPGQDAIGQRFRVGRDTMPFLTVVGIAEDMHAARLTGSPEFWYYLPMEQYRVMFGSSNLALFARVNGRAEDYAEPLRRRLQQEMPGVSYIRSSTMRQLVAPRQQSWQFGATMFVAFGGLALILAAIGLYSVIAYAVAQRTHELGVRIALGASISDVTRMIMGQGLSFAVAGVLLGSTIALWAGKWVEPLLFAQKARDPLIFGGVAMVLLIVAVVATLRPAIRATRVDPTVALRSD